MARGTLRVMNWNAREMASRERHNLRLYTPNRMPDNIDVKLTPTNDSYIANDRSSILEALQERLEGVPVRKNSVVAIEFVMGASADFFNKNYDTHGYLSKCKDFIAERYGWDNFLSVHFHYDEATPHVHLLMVPIKEKAIKWKNQKSKGVKKERRLNARDITGGPSKLRALQNDFYKFIVPMGEIAGVPFEKRVSAEDQTKEYTRKTDYRMAQINKIAELARLEVDAAKRLELQQQILVQHEELKKELQKKAEAEKNALAHKKFNKKFRPRGL